MTRHMYEGCVEVGTGVVVDRKYTHRMGEEAGSYRRRSWVLFFVTVAGACLRNSHLLWVLT